MCDGTNPCRVVLCDDAEDFMRLVELLFEMHGDLQVVGQAANGEEAIEACAQLQPDVLLLDVSMPVMDGITALPMIRQVSPRTKVLMLSGFSSMGMRQRALDLGASAYIEKGVQPTSLPEQVKQHC